MVSTFPWMETKDYGNPDLVFHTQVLGKNSAYNFGQVFEQLRS